VADSQRLFDFDR